MSLSDSANVQAFAEVRAAVGKDAEFERVTDWVERLNRGLNNARSDQVRTQNLVSSAEYELQQLRRYLSGDQPESSVPERSSPQPPSEPQQAGADHDAAAIFNLKMRHPESLRRGWWSVLGLGV